MNAAGESQVYRDLMRFQPDGLSPNAWAVKAGVSRTVWADMRRHGNPSRRTLERLLAAAGSSLAEFEALRLGPERRGSEPNAGQVGDPSRAWVSAAPAPLPLIGSALAGEWGESGSQIELTQIRPEELLERLPRPISLASDPDAFAVTVVGDSMWPRFAPGARIAVSPRSPVAIGDDVLLRLSGAPGVATGKLALIKRLVKRSASETALRQFNPDVTFRVSADDADALFKVAGELI